MNTRGEYFGGFIFLLCFVLFVAVMLTHGLWWNPMKPEEQARFVVDAMVGVGTLALAGVTTYNILQTRDLISGEERRHAQGLAPLVLIGQDADYFTVRNVGSGLALHCVVEIWITYELSRNVLALKEQSDYAALRADHPNAQDFTPENGSESIGFTYWQEHRAEPKWGDVFPVLPPRARSERIRLIGEWVLLRDRIKSIRAQVSYTDQFDNPYQTRYLPGNLSVYEWVKPPYLYDSTQGRVLQKADGDNS